MAQINECPKFDSVEDIPYTITLRLRLQYAKDFTPHKVAYYEEVLKQWLAAPVFSGCPPYQSEL